MVKWTNHEKTVADPDTVPANRTFRYDHRLAMNSYYLQQQFTFYQAARVKCDLLTLTGVSITQSSMLRNRLATRRVLLIIGVWWTARQELNNYEYDNVLKNKNVIYIPNNQPIHKQFFSVRNCKLIRKTVQFMHTKKTKGKDPVLWQHQQEDWLLQPSCNLTADRNKDDDIRPIDVGQVLLPWRLASNPTMFRPVEIRISVNNACKAAVHPAPSNNTSPNYILAK